MYSYYHYPILWHQENQLLAAGRLFGINMPFISLEETDQFDKSGLYAVKRRVKTALNQINLSDLWQKLSDQTYLIEKDLYTVEKIVYDYIYNLGLELDQLSQLLKLSSYAFAGVITHLEYEHELLLRSDTIKKEDRIDLINFMHAYNKHYNQNKKRFIELAYHSFVCIQIGNELKDGTYKRNGAKPIITNNEIDAIIESSLPGESLRDLAKRLLESNESYQYEMKRKQDLLGIEEAKERVIESLKQRIYRRKKALS